MGIIKKEVIDMKIILQEENCKNITGENAKVTNAILNAFRDVVAEFPGLKTGKLIVEDEKISDGNSPHFIVCATPEDGEGDNCAREKIEVLRSHPSAVNSKEIALSNGDRWYGGVNIHYSGYESEEMNKVSGTVRIAFSGAKEAVDLFITLAVLKRYLAACDIHCGVSSYSYELETLQNDQLSGFYARMIGLIA